MGANCLYSGLSTYPVSEICSQFEHSTWHKWDSDGWKSSIHPTSIYLNEGFFNQR